MLKICVPNHTFLLRFGGISGSFSLAMRILARPRLAKIRTMARPNSPDMPSKRTKKVRLGISSDAKEWNDYDMTCVIVHIAQNAWTSSIIHKRRGG